MKTLDFAVLIVFAACVVYDTARGAMKSLATVSSLFIGFYGGGTMALIVPLLKPLTPMAVMINHIIYAAALFMASFLTLRVFVMAGRLVGLRNFDKNLGFILGLVRGLVAGTALAMVGKLYAPKDQVGALVEFLNNAFKFAWAEVVKT